jgi:predicted  nucleic acid-binding Zn-ribbon protein
MPEIRNTDPYIRIISSVKAPLQRYNWRKERQKAMEQVLRKLPVELHDMVREQANDTIELEEMKRQIVRLLNELRLMAQRKEGLFESESVGLAW